MKEDRSMKHFFTQDTMLFPCYDDDSSVFADRIGSG